MSISEKSFEETIEAALCAGAPGQPRSVREAPAGLFEPGGYRQRPPADYDPALCLIPEDVIAFLQATQPEEWAKLKRLKREGARDSLLRRLSEEIGRRGVVDVLRKGIKDSGARFQLYYHKPASTLNPEIQQHYRANGFTVMRQVHYATRSGDAGKSLDLVLFLNGIPLFTAELKNELTGQNVTHAIRQYQRDRDPREPLFAAGRCLAHFAVDTHLVYFTTHLRGEKTAFLPFNQGFERGAGNPPSFFGYDTAYLWEQVWARDSVLNLVQNFVYRLESAGKEHTVIFPRYHQLDAVRRLLADALAHGAGQRYLIQHSAGSGKSYSIAWLAHQLSTLHDAENKRVFDSIIVVTDRRVLDQALQRHVENFEQTRGLVANIGENQHSADLRKALEEGKDIIVTTIQKFPYIVDTIGAMSQARFAVIIDEAHSSQGGETAHKMQQVLNVSTLEEAEAIDADSGEDWEDQVVEAARSRGMLPNVSYFAFTATPKAKTLELFGTRRPDGQYEAFSLYAMKQAIDEGFILDVLQNYITYQTYWNLLKKIEDDPTYDKKKATYLLKHFVDLHHITIERKAEIMLAHFDGQARHQVNGQAKAMIVTRSRLHAVRYKLIIDRLIREHGYPFEALVAFSGKVDDGGKSYTESGMNSESSGERIPESGTADAFKGERFRIMIVAEKFQTGFDEPRLHTMYVDKRLQGLHAVQTLSRLNRIYPPHKKEVVVIDFVNEVEDIEAAFLPYYDRTLLSHETDPNLLYDYEGEIRGYNLFTDDDLNAFAREYFSPNPNQAKLYRIFSPALAHFEQLENADKKACKQFLKKYVRLYAFLGQVARFQDPELEKLYYYAYYLDRLAKLEAEELPLEIIDAIDLESLRVQHTGTSRIDLKQTGATLEPESGLPQGMEDAEKEALSRIIAELNQRFGTEWTEEDQLRVIEEIERGLDTSLALRNSVAVNTPENAKLTFDDILDDLLQEMIDTHFKFYKQINGNPDLGQRFREIMYTRYRERVAPPGA
ncbi:MAG: type I restriction endonuclease subunit R [Anaerolineae bacterium]|nr:type I restriction endonuclease subunit R [Anaerolineae bacterium]